MSARSPEQLLDLARLQREAFAYDAGASRLRSVRASRIPWLVRLLRSRSGDQIVGTALAYMSAELAVLHLASHLVDATGDASLAIGA